MLIKKINLQLFDSAADKKDPLADVQAKIDAMLAKASEAANKIVVEAQKQAEKIVSTAKTSGPAQTITDKEKAEFDAYMNEKVPVYLFKDNNKYRDDVPITVNGETILIQRGKQVMIKRKFAQALENSMIQDAYAADHMTDLADQYRQKEPRLS